MYMEVYVPLLGILISYTIKLFLVRKVQRPCIPLHPQSHVCLHPYTPVVTARKGSRNFVVVNVNNLYSFKSSFYLSHPNPPDTNSLHTILRFFPCYKSSAIKQIKVELWGQTQLCKIEPKRLIVSGKLSTSIFSSVK